MADFALRDATLYSRPSQDRPIAYHAVVAPGWIAACNQNVWLTHYTAQPHTAVAPGMVCQRRACLNAYRAALAAPSHEETR